MNIRFTIPYAHDKNLGYAYNEEVNRAKPNEWVGFCDRDTIMHLPDFGHKISTIVAEHGEGVYTCTTNRTNCSWQRLEVGATNDIEYHQTVAQEQWDKWETTVTDHADSQLMSGHLMVVKKELWTPIQKKGILGIDNLVHEYAREKELPVYLMKGIYCYHWYSNYHNFGNGSAHRQRDKTHLK